MQITPNMGLRVWNLIGDFFDHGTLADNLIELDGHDHTAGNGVPISTGGLADGSVTTPKLADGAVTPRKLAYGNWTTLSLNVGLTTATNLSAAPYTPSARIVSDTVQLRGAVENTTGGTISSTVTICTLPVQMRPSAFVVLTAVTAVNVVGILTIATSGTMALNLTNFVNHDVLFLDGRTYTV